MTDEDYNCECGHESFQHVHKGVCLLCFCIKFRPDYTDPLPTDDSEEDEDESKK